MKKFIPVGLLILCSFSSYASQCKTDYEQKNYEKAFIECKQEAEQGHSSAQYNLAFMYDDGEGIEQDKVKAAYWYTKAAEQGEANAQYNL
ncbi:tetratricopeptide repeat protein, partial [uncultured Gilliamella sp.]